MAKVIMPVAQGFEETEAVATIDVLRRGGVEVLIAGVDGEFLKSKNGIMMKAEVSIDAVEADDADMVVLPGGGQCAQTLTRDQRVQKLLKEMDAKGKKLGAICAAPLALNAAGVIKEAYTCYPSVEEMIGTDKFKDQNVVVSGNVVTSRGPGTAICFGLAILAELMGEEAAEAVRKEMVATC